MDRIYIPQNLVSSRQVISPSKRYHLTIQSYKPSKPKCWNYTRCIVRRVSDDQILFQIDRNYPTFTHKFFDRDGHEWMYCGETYQQQSVIDLDSKQKYDNLDESTLCWASVYPNSTGKILMVSGCIWGGPTELYMFDITHPDGAWPQISIQNDDYIFPLLSDSIEPEWIDERTFEVSYSCDWAVKYGKMFDDLTLSEMNDNIEQEDNYELLLFRIRFQLSDNIFIPTERTISAYYQTRLKNRHLDSDIQIVEAEPVLEQD